MAVSITDTIVTRVTGFSAGDPFTYMAWVRWSFDAYYTIYVSDTDSEAESYVYVYIQPNNGEYELEIYDDVPSEWYYSAKQGKPTQYQWVHVALVRSGSTYSLYMSTQDKYTMDVALTDYITGYAANLVPNTFQFKFETDVSAIKQVRVWSTNLSVAEIRAERDSATAVKTANLYSDTPLSNDTDLDDVSGNGNDWTFDILGDIVNYVPPIVPVSPTVVSSVPIVYHENTIGEDSNYVSWYKYTALSDNYPLLGVVAFADITSNFLPTIDIFAGDETDPYMMTPIYAPLAVYTPGSDTENIALMDARQRPVEIPIRQGETYYVKITNGIGGTFPINADLDVTFQYAPNLVGEVPAGSIFITDDTDCFPSCFLEPTTGSLIKFINIRASDFGVYLPSGHFCLEYGRGHMDFWSWVAVYGPDLSLIAAPQVNNYISNISHNGTDAFYISDYDPFGTDAYVSRLTTAGVLEYAKWVLPYSSAPQIIAFAPTWNETILYYTGRTTGIRRWDLINNVQLSNLTPDPVPPDHLKYWVIPDLLVLPDQTIIWGKRPSPFQAEVASYIYHYNASGTLLHTYGPYPRASMQLNRMCMLFDTSDYFWVWFFTDLDTSDALPSSTFKKIRVSDGVVVQEFKQWLFQSGQGHKWDPLWPDGDPPLFQHSGSCSLMVLPTGVEPPVVQVGGIYILVPGKRDDTVWTSFDPLTSEDVKIPDPFAKTALLGE